MVQQASHIEPMRIERSGQDSLKTIIRASWVVLWLAVLYQLIFYAEITNFIGIAAVVFAWLLTTKIWLRKQMLETYLISIFMLIGFVASQFYLPLIFTTIENKPLIYNLELPEEVFLHSTLALLVLVASHAIYRTLMSTTRDRSFSVMEKAGFFEPPTHLQLWIMGAIGMISSFYVYFSAPEVGAAVTGSASDKLVQALVPFTYAPFFIPLSRLYGNTQKTPRSFALMLTIYALLLLAISIGRNSRGAFILGLTNPVFAYVLGLMVGVFKTRLFSVKNFVIGGVIVWVLTGPLADLGTAMLNVRGTRTEISAMELISLTFEALNDKEAIRARKADDLNETIDFDWDEHYLDNIYTARFANIKFNDNNLITFSRVGTYDPDMQDFAFSQFVAVLPDPIIRRFNLDVDKELVLSQSFGDFLYGLSGGQGAPIGFRVGHFAGTGMAGFGWWYLLLLAILVIPCFYVNDKLFKPRRDFSQSSGDDSQQKFRFSFCGVLALTSFFQFMNFESVVNLSTYLIRGWIQMVLLYFLVFHLSRFVDLAITGRKRQVRLTPN